MSTPETITVDEVAAKWGRTPARVRQLVKEGKLPKLDRGDFNLRELFDMLVPILTEKQASAGDLNAAKLRNELLKGDALERAKQIAEGEMLPLSQLQAVAMTVIPGVRKQLKGLLLGKMPTLCAGRTQAQIREIGGKEYTKILRRLQKPHKAFMEGKLPKEEEEDESDA